MKTGTLRRAWKACAGMTLVELIITFALIGVFMTAASFMLTTSVQMYTRIINTANGVMVSDLLLDKMAGEIAAASLPPNQTRGYYFWLDNSDASSWVVFENRVGRPLAMYEADGRLFLKYYQMEDTNQRGFRGTDWHFDDKVYMGYRITKLLFSQPDPGDHPDVVKMELELKHDRTGFVYHTERYAKNYNYDPASEYMGARSDGGSGMPENAEDFKITIQGGGADGEELILDEKD